MGMVTFGNTLRVSGPRRLSGLSEGSRRRRVSPSPSPSAAAARALPAVLVLLLAAAVALLALAASPLVKPACAYEAQPGGYVTVSGLADVDETQPFYLLSEALAAISSCDPTLASQDASGPVVYVHGQVPVESDGSGAWYSVAFPVEGATVSFVGADDAASFVDPEGGALMGVSFPGGSLSFTNLGFEGVVYLSCGDGLSVDCCLFHDAVVCSVGGSAWVSGNWFQAQSESSDAALTATLSGVWSQVAFVGNSVSGFACGLSVSNSCGSGDQYVRVASNSFDLSVPSDAASAGQTAAAVALAGGPWGQGSLSLEGNAVSGAASLVRLSDSFSLLAVADAGLAVESLAEDSLDAVSLSGLLDLGSCDANDLSAELTSVFDAESASSVAMGHAMLDASSLSCSTLGTSSPASAYVVVSYDANGATAGSAPEPVAVEAGSSVSVANMGSLIWAGYVFEGWNTAPDGTGVFYAAGQLFTPASDVVLYAQWVPTGKVASSTPLSASEDAASAGV